LAASVFWCSVDKPQMTKHARKVLIGIAGGFVLLIGIAMIVLPGPAFIVIPAGLAILATEFEWARRWLEKARAYIHNKREAYRKKRAAKTSRT
jgi:tellurite resistance protein TerC